MGRCWVMMVMVMMRILIDIERSDGCLENERNALLEIKSFINYPNGSFLSSWGMHADCCKWERVECNSTTRSVTTLSLSNMRDWQLREQHLNASLFLPFSELRSLYLQLNQFVGCIKNEGFEKLSRLSNLELLHLGLNNFDNSIFSSLVALSSLKYLYLNSNNFKETIFIDDVPSNLEMLDLSNNQIEKFESSEGSKRLGNLELLDLGYNKFNTTTFSSLALPSLRYLHLNNNNLKGTLFVEKLVSMSNLEELDLSKNQIEKFTSSRDVTSPSNLSALYLDDMVTEGRSKLLESLGALPTLKKLYLRGGYFRGTIISQGLYNLSNVEELYLDRSSLDEKSFQCFGAMSSLKFLSLVNCNGSLPSKGLTNFKYLEELYLDGSASNSSFLQIVAMMTSLKILSLSNCQLNNTLLANQGLCQLRHLQELYLGSNNLGGSFPICLVNLSSLEVLDISNNQLSGNVNHLRELTSLQSINLSYNLIQIPISLHPFFNHSGLTRFNGEGNNISADAKNHFFTPKFQLKYLSLSSSRNVGQIPKFLYYQRNLQELYLSHLKMRGRFPHWLLENNTELQSLSLDNNCLLGSIQLPIHPHMNLQQLDISENCFSSYIPKNFGAYLIGLTYLNMSRNGFNGSIPSTFEDMSSLETLDLSNNELSGIIPNSLYNITGLTVLAISDNHLYGRIPEWIGNMQALYILDLSKNNFYGSLPSIFNTRRMRQLYLSKNKLQGSFASALYNCTSLTTLDVSHNLMTGSIPAWINRLSLLRILLLSFNKLRGEIPIQLCELNRLSLIDLSHNNLSGRILQCLKCHAMQNTGERYDPFLEGFPLWLISVQFTTKSNSYQYQAKMIMYFSGIDLSCNSFTGQIPSEIGNLNTIKVLNLSHNSLTGSIPPTLANLNEIESLDVSFNNLQGKIPHQLISLKSLAVFNVSYNNLSGRTPEMIAQFATFDESSYKGNPFLYGCPLPQNCSERMSPPSASTPNHREKSSCGFIEMKDFYSSFGVSYTITVLGIILVLYINCYWRRAWFYYAQVSMDICYYFIVDNLFFRFKFYRLCRWRV